MFGSRTPHWTSEAIPIHNRTNGICRKIFRTVEILNELQLKSDFFLYTKPPSASSRVQKNVASESRDQHLNLELQLDKS